MLWLSSCALAAEPMARLPVVRVSVDAGDDQGPLELWRQGIGHGGINSHPLPEQVIEGTKALHPRLIRIFIQEFFQIYPEHGKFDWSKLDPYMDSFAKTGAKVVAAITIKPKPLYPKIDQTIWRPNDLAEWQKVVGALVKRYSVDKPIVTYWEIGNETDIGENGGCPYLIRDPNDYAQYYRMTADAVVAAFPAAKVGGTAVANAGGDYLPKFIQIAKDQKLRLDFVSWHLYSDNPDAHAGLVAKYRNLLNGFDKKPEILVTEWSKSFEPVSVEEAAFEPRRAAITAATIIAFHQSKVDWTFYYHLWDRVAFTDEFKPFFANPGIMYHHWNEVPHRFALFGVNQEPRPQYFVFRMLGDMGEREVKAETKEKDLRILAGKDSTKTAILLANLGPDRIAAIHFSHLQPGHRTLTIRRIDSQRQWDAKTLTLIPTERREVDVQENFESQVYLPADSVALMILEPAE